MTKTSKELIKQAEKLAQCQNSETFDFAFKIQLLNNVYTNVYNELSGYANYFIRYFDFTGKESDLPPDCNKVLMVFRGSKDNPYVLTQSSYNNFVPGSYYIENNTIRIVDKTSDTIHVKYSAMPLILTAPEDPEKLEFTINDTELTPTSFSYQDDEYLYFKALDEEGEEADYRYSFEDKTVESVTEVPEFEHTFNNLPFAISKTDEIVNQVLWNGEDITDYFIAYDANTGEEIQPKDITWDNTHIAITYENDDVYVMTADFEKSQVNPFLMKGRYFKGEAVSICADDETGLGLICKYKDDYYLMSFVPDTLLEYPDNVFFEYIEDLFAVQLQGLVGLNNESLQTKLTNDEKAFFTSLERSSQGQRIRNDSNNYKRAWW